MKNFFQTLTKAFQKRKEKPKEIKEAQPLELKKVPNVLEEEKVKTRVREIILDARDQAFEIKRKAEEEMKRGEEKILEREKKMFQKERELRRNLEEVEKTRKEEVERLERIAKLTKEEAKELILKRLEKDLSQDLAKMIKNAEDKAREEAERKAKEILVDAMQRGATNYVAEYTVSQVKLPDEEMKGRIIGKEGRNIRAFEKATGIDVDLDEEGVIRLSSFDSIRREIARVALKRLIADGRIQPVRIEEIVRRTKQDLEKIMFKEGQKLAHRVGVYNLPQDKIALLGRFKYRFSHGQNMIDHTLEETKIGVAIAQEVEADVNTVRLGCLLHDIGKVIVDEEGNHVEKGIELLQKNGIPRAVVNCVAQHHEDTPFTSVEAMIVNIADSISGARPGARFEDYEKYVQRLNELEETAKSFKGVKEAYAFQAGRELRVAVSPEEVSDAEAQVIAQKIRKEIEKKSSFPGQVKVMVIRETRTIEVTQ